MSSRTAVISLRIFHSLLVIYFTACLLYIYYSLFVFPSYALLGVDFLSLGIEGFIVFMLSGGNCPLIHVQRRVGDPTPFFELLLPARLAKQAIPLFSVLTLIGLIALAIRLHVTNY